jgi:hypothetical protein
VNAENAYGNIAPIKRPEKTNGYVKVTLLSVN